MGPASGGIRRISEFSVVEHEAEWGRNTDQTLNRNSTTSPSAIT